MSLVGFSRLYLGVHTPQDVLVAFIAGMFVMSLTILLLRWVEAHPEKDWIVVVTGLDSFVIGALRRFQALSDRL